MKRMATISGGLASFLAAHRTIERYGKEGLTLVFADTTVEDADLYRFNRDIEAFFGMTLVVLCAGKTPWDVIFEKKFLNQRKADCSKQLKGVLLDKWADENKPDIRVIGLDWTERSRLVDIRERMPTTIFESPMNEAPFLTKAGMAHETERLGLRPPRMYAEGYEHNNCAGSCVKAGIGHWKHHLKTRPDEYAKAEAKENEFRALYGDHSILRDRRNRKSVPLPLTKLRQMVEANTSPSLFDDEEWGGCGCAIDSIGEQ